MDGLLLRLFLVEMNNFVFAGNIIQIKLTAQKELSHLQQSKQFLG